MHEGVAQKKQDWCLMPLGHSFFNQRVNERRTPHRRRYRSLRRNSCCPRLSTRQRQSCLAQLKQLLIWATSDCPPPVHRRLFLALGDEPLARNAHPSPAKQLTEIASNVNKNNHAQKSTPEYILLHNSAVDTREDSQSRTATSTTFGITYTQKVRDKDNRMPLQVAPHLATPMAQISERCKSSPPAEPFGPTYKTHSTIAYGPHAPAM